MNTQETQEQNVGSRMKPYAIKKSKVGEAFFYIFVVLTLGLLMIWYVWKQNNLRQIEQKIQESDSDIDVALTKKVEMLTKLHSTTQSTMKWEKSTLTEITKLRSMDFSSMSAEEKSKAIAEMNKVSRDWNFQMEAYPQLQSVQAVKQLNNAIVQNDNEIAAARRIYNSNVSVWNTETITWPANIISANNKFWTKGYLTADELNKKDPDMNLEA